MWLRENKVDLSKYLPKFLQRDINFNAVTETESNEHDRVRLLLKDVFAQFFVESATWGLDIYEKILDLTPKPNDDYARRRLRILSRLQFAQTSTVQFMTELVKRYTAANADVAVIEMNSDYSFKIKVRGGNIIYMQDLLEAVELYKPAHLGWLLSRHQQFENNIFIAQTLLVGQNTAIYPTATKLLPITSILSAGQVIRLVKHQTIYQRTVNANPLNNKVIVGSGYYQSRHITIHPAKEA